MKKVIALILTLTLLFSLSLQVGAKSASDTSPQVPPTDAPEYNCKAAVLMEATTGKVLYSSNSSASMHIASVTKVMTLLLAAEALDAGAFKLEDKVSISAYAASMGGSQVFLEEGERISVEDLFKCTVIASANDAAVALAELVSGSESAFVRKMNARAMELGLSSTVFENVTGLDDTVTNHVSSAMDIAVMSRELLKHDIVTKYSSVWQDTIRDGAFTLTNTNRLVRFYDGCTGLKTGSTDKAGYCVSTTAKRGNMHLIAVILGAPDRDTRNNIARELLDLGFSGYSLFEKPESRLKDIRVLRGKVPEVAIYTGEVAFLTDRSSFSRIEEVYTAPESIKAPIGINQQIGKVEYMLDGVKIGECAIYSKTEVRCVSYTDILLLMLTSLFGK